jgi:hypothetical protein
LIPGAGPLLRFRGGVAFCLRKFHPLISDLDRQPKRELRITRNEIEFGLVHRRMKPWKYGDATSSWSVQPRLRPLAAWDSKASHEASLSLPSVKEAIAKGRPLIAGFNDRVVTTPVGGTGLALPDRVR